MSQLQSYDRRRPMVTDTGLIVRNRRWVTSGGKSLLEQAFQQQPELAELANMVNAFLLADVDGECPSVFQLLEKGDQPTVFDVPLAYAYLKGLFVGVAQLQVIDVFQDFIDAAALHRTVDVGAGVERQS